MRTERTHLNGPAVPDDDLSNFVRRPAGPHARLGHVLHDAILDAGHAALYPPLKDARELVARLEALCERRDKRHQRGRDHARREEWKRDVELEEDAVEVGPRRRAEELAPEHGARRALEHGPHRPLGEVQLELATCGVNRGAEGGHSVAGRVDEVAERALELGLLERAGVGREEILFHRGAGPDAGRGAKDAALHHLADRDLRARP